MIDTFGQQNILYTLRLYEEATTTTIANHLVEKHNLKPKYDIRILVSRRLNQLRSWGKVDRRIGGKTASGREVFWFVK